jgi:hypothetical protein
MMLVKPGDRLRSRVCTTEVIVVKASSIDVEITCGGEPMTKDQPVAAATAGDSAAGPGPGTLLGKRYADQDAGLELLCVKGGSGQVSVDGRTLALREARPLPASD